MTDKRTDDPVWHFVTAAQPPFGDVSVKLRTAELELIAAACEEMLEKGRSAVFRQTAAVLKDKIEAALELAKGRPHPWKDK